MGTRPEGDPDGAGAVVGGAGDRAPGTVGAWVGPVVTVGGVGGGFAGVGWTDVCCCACFGADAASGFVRPRNHSLDGGCMKSSTTAPMRAKSAIPLNT